MSNTPNYQLVDINELEAKLTEIATELRLFTGETDSKWQWPNVYSEKVKGLFSNVKSSDLARSIENYTLDRMGVPLDEENEYIMLAIGEFANFEKMKTFTIPEKKKVVVLDLGTFMNCKSLKEAIFPDATHCGGLTFYGCSEIETIRLPSWNGTRTYGELADPVQCFAGCKKLITFEAPLEYLYQSEFEGCESLTEINFDKVTEVEEAVFKDCKSLTKVNMPLLYNFSESLFENCESLNEINCAITKATVPSRAFKNCINLTDYLYPANIFNEECFYNCKNLKSFQLGTISPLSVDVGAFEGCKNLVFPIDTFNTINERGLKGCEKIEHIEKSTSSSIGSQACMGCTGLKSFNGVDTYNIGSEAFKDCINLETVQIGRGNPSGTKVLGENAFENCNKIKNYLTPYHNIDSYVYSHHDNIEILNIGNSALDGNYFEGWSSLIEATLLNALTIGDYTFKNCINLNKIFLPMVSNFGVGLFENCPNLKILDFGSLTTFTDFPEIENLTLNSFACGYNGELYENILEKLKNIGDLSLTEITTIPDNAFLNNTTLWRFSAPSVTTIGNNAFDGCSELMEVNLTGTIKLGDGVFRGCNKLQNLNISNISILENLGNNNLTQFKGLTLGLTEYPSNFLNNGLIETLHVAKSPTTIGANAFANNENLTSVVLDGASYGAAENMFANCTNLTSVRLNGTQKATLDNTMFDNTPIMKGGNGVIKVYSSKLSYYQSNYPNWNFVAG